MANRNGTSARRKSRRLAIINTGETEVQEPSPRSDTAESDNNLPPTVDLIDTDGPVAPNPNDGNSSDITPPPEIVVPKPKTKQKRKQPAKRSVISLSGDSDDDTPPANKPRKSATKEATKEAEQEDLGTRKLILHIPRALEVGNQRVEFTHATAFDEALDVIHETVGCAEVARKPILTYKLASAASKTPAMTLNSEKDWQGCLDDVRQAERAKKAGTIIAVHIVVSEQYIASLMAKLGKGKAAAGKTGCKFKVQILDLDHAESGDDDFDEGLGGMEKETKCLELQKHYGRCQLCGPTKVCKITVAGTHHPMSNNQQRAWSQALVRNSFCPISCRLA
ncbi:hypothetical protein C8R44DRAFT_894251 [Mycena epipterygia]|nr:hypothetical protein C8R44DRAFT_894251 [Mycena epipterygia]